MIHQQSFKRPYLLAKHPQEEVLASPPRFSRLRSSVKSECRSHMSPQTKTKPLLSEAPKHQLANSVIFSQASDVRTAPYSEGLNTTQEGETPLLNLTKADLRGLRVRSNTSARERKRRVDKKGRYMRDILKQSDAFENFFTVTESGQSQH